MSHGFQEVTHHFATSEADHKASGIPITRPASLRIISPGVFHWWLGDMGFNGGGGGGGGGSGGG